VTFKLILAGIFGCQHKQTIMLSNIKINHKYKMKIEAWMNISWYGR
jgi:hypothetical protein